MRTIPISIGVLLISTAAFAAEQSSAKPNPKLVEMFAAKDEKGKPIITPEQQEYFNGLNDNLKELLNRAVEKETITRPEHLSILLSLQLRPQKMELVLQNNCILCHSDSANQSADELFSLASNAGPSPSHMNLKEIVEDVHFRRGVSCAGCHGGDPTADLGHAHVKEWPEKDREKNRAWVVQFCARCHSDPAMMHEFNPALPTDQLAKFKDSPHGHRLLDQHDDRAPSCVSCHGVHGIRPAKDPQSKVYAQRVPETCGACHADSKSWPGSRVRTVRRCRPLSSPNFAIACMAARCFNAAIWARPRATIATATTAQSARCREREPQLQPLPLGQCESLRRQQTQAGVRPAQLAGVQQVPWQPCHREDARHDVGGRAGRVVHRLP